VLRPKKAPPFKLLEEDSMHPGDGRAG